MPEVRGVDSPVEMCTTLRDLLRCYLHATDERERERLRGPVTERVAAELLRMLTERALSDSHPPVRLRVERVLPHVLGGDVAEDKIEHYLARVVTNAIRDARRQERRHQGVQGVEIQQVADPKAPDTVRIIAARERVALVRRAMVGMPENYRFAIDEIYFKGRDRDELAEERGVLPGTVDRWVSRARTWLEKRMTELDEEERS
ncbi:MAG: sigma-70 family RNA polymerase sigma factor [Pseudomonadota bacterium]